MNNKTIIRFEGVDGDEFKESSIINTTEWLGYLGRCPGITDVTNMGYLYILNQDIEFTYKNGKYNVNYKKDKANLESVEEQESSNQIESSELQSDNQIDTENVALDTNKETTVRRLSLFDTVKQDQEDISLNKDHNVREEPVISSNLNDDKELNLEEENSKSLDNSDSEIGGEESEISDLDEEFNQETEELLDIPTFLRRQAN